MNTNLMFSSEDLSWETPQWLFDILNDEFNFTLDVCAVEATAKCERYFSPSEDGLSQEWTGICFMNPPYGREIGKWIKKAYEESRKDNCIVVALIASRTDTRYWHDYVMKAKEVRLIKGRLVFGQPGKVNVDPAPFPSAVVVFSNESETPIFSAMSSKPPST